MRAAEAARKTSESQLPLLPFEGDIVCLRTPHGTQFNIPQRIIRHSPTGMEWGYGGSGPADFALNILALFIGQEQAERNGLYQDFKWDFVATLPREGGVIKRDDILNLLAQRGFMVEAAS